MNKKEKDLLNISLFIDNEMTEEEKELFLQEIETSSDLETELEFTKEIVKEVKKIEKVELPIDFRKKWISKLKNQTKEEKIDTTEILLTTEDVESKDDEENNKVIKYDFGNIRFINKVLAVAATLFIVAGASIVGLRVKNSRSIGDMSVKNPNMKNSFSGGADIETPEISPVLEDSPMLRGSIEKDDVFVKHYEVSIDTNEVKESYRKTLELYEDVNYSGYNEFEIPTAIVNINIESDKYNELLESLKEVGDVTEEFDYNIEIFNNKNNLVNQINAQKKFYNNLITLVEESETHNDLDVLEIATWETENQITNIGKEIATIDHLSNKSTVSIRFYDETENVDGEYLYHTEEEYLFNNTSDNIYIHSNTVVDDYSQLLQTIKSFDGELLEEENSFPPDDDYMSYYFTIKLPKEKYQGFQQEVLTKYKVFYMKEYLIKEYNDDSYKESYYQAALNKVNAMLETDEGNKSLNFKKEQYANDLEFSRDGYLEEDFIKIDISLEKSE